MNAIPRCCLLLSLLLSAMPVLAGPPLLCHPFDTGGAATLDWGKGGWNEARRDYDLERLVAQTQDLLSADAPVIVRMETLRRAAIYASRRGDVLRALDAALEARVARADGDERQALALFDAGYLLETLEDILRLQGYDMPGVGRIDAAALRTVLQGRDGSERIAAALELRPGDAALHFAAALVAEADGRSTDRDAHARFARAAASTSPLVERNLGRIAR